MQYLGIDVGGTTIKAGLANEAGQLGETRQISTNGSDLEAFVHSLTQLIRDFQKVTSVAGVGMGVPGLYSFRTRTIETSPNIPCLQHVNLEDRIAPAVGVPVLVENDANAGAYGEAACGAARGLRNVAYLTIGTGLGGGIVLGGHMYCGASGYAGEIGHTAVDLDGRLCGCGAHGCLETLVSAPGIVKTALEGPLSQLPGPLTAERIYDEAIAGNAAAQAVFDKTGRYLGLACANLIVLLNLEAIVIAGGVMASGPLLLEPAIREARRHAFAQSFADCKIVQSELWPNAGMIGAAMLIRDRK